MSATGLEVFDKTIQITNIWLNQITAELGPDRHFAWHVLGVVMRRLRDQLPPEMAVHLGAQLPMLVRGAYYESWKTPAEPERIRTADMFLERIAAGLATTRSVAPAAAAKAVFGVLSRHVDRDQIVKVRACLSERIRRLWPESLLEPEVASEVPEERTKGRRSRAGQRASRLNGPARESPERVARGLDSKGVAAQRRAGRTTKAKAASASARGKSSKPGAREAHHPTPTSH